MLRIKNEEVVRTKDEYDEGIHPVEVSEIIKVFAALTAMFMEADRGERSMYFCTMEVDGKGKIKFMNRKAGKTENGDDYYEYWGRR